LRLTFRNPATIGGIAGRMAYSEPTGLFSLIWDEAVTDDMPPNSPKPSPAPVPPTWPYTWVVLKYASMAEHKQYARPITSTALWACLSGNTK